MFDWLKKILGISTNNSSSESKDEGINNSTLDSVYARLDKKNIDAKKEKESFKQSSIDWYSLIIRRNKKSTTNIYYPYSFEQLLNLKTLKEKRLKREAYELKALEEEVNTSLGEIENYIVQRKIEKAKPLIEVVRSKISRVKDSSIRQQYINLQNNLSKLMDELEQERLVLLVKEQKHKEEEERKKKESKEQARKEKERQASEKQRKKQEKVNRFAEEARKREQTKQTEKQRLELLSSEQKENWADFKQVLKNYGIQYLYHFTDRRNIPSIKRNGGLLSWNYCVQHKIDIPSPGGGNLSRQLDISRNLQDYVRLSFTTQHPMMYIAMKDGRIDNPVILKIDPSVVYLKHTKYSNMNATIKRLAPNIGTSLEDFKKIHFNSVKVQTHFDLNVEEQPYFQAEVMVKTFISKKYIVNLDTI